MCVYVCVYMCVHMHTRVDNLCNSLHASVTKIKLVLISCAIQCSGACSKHMRKEFGRKTVENLIVGGKMLISVFSKYSVRMWTEFVWLRIGKTRRLLWMWV